MSNGVIYCSRCGAQNSTLAKFCANCGTPFVPEQPSLETGQVSPRPQSPAAPLTPPTFPAAAYPPAFPAAAYPPTFPAAAYPPTFAGIRYAGFWIRFVAFIIDALVVGIVVVPISAIISLIIGVAGDVVSMPGVGVHLVKIIVGSVFSSAANWIYEASMESSSKQATLGKMALGLKVTDLEGRRISFARATGRHFAKLLSGMVLLIGYIIAGFTPRKQALHDLIAGTLVVHG